MTKWLQQLSISQRLFILLGIAATGTALLVIFILVNLRGVILNGEQQKLDALNDAAITIVESYHSLQRSGEMTEAEAQQAAILQLDNIRYEGNEYIFTLNRQGVLVQHPFSAQQGRNVSDFADPNGTLLFKLMLERTEQAERATVNYIWELPNSQELGPKISRVRAFAPWGWVLGSGVYIDDLASQLWTQFWRLALISISLSVPLLLVFMLIIRSIVTPLRLTIAALNDIAEGEGDLTHRLPEQGRDEIASLAKGFNNFVGNIQELVKAVQESAEHEQAAAQRLRELTESSSKLSGDLVMQTNSVATAIHELSASASEVAGHARHAAESASDADSQAERSGEIVHSAVVNVESLADQLNSASQHAELLQQGSAKIGDILSVIVNISEQTNLLALNAAIEAARAGDAGRGFAVVASEVRTLATRTQDSTEEINSLIHTIQQSIKDVSEVIYQVQQTSQLTRDETVEAETAIAAIRQAVENISSMNIQIANATDEQSRVTHEVNGRVDEISELSENNETNNQSLNQLSTALNNSSLELSKLVSRFKTH